MDVTTEGVEGDLCPYQPESLVQALKCPVCLDYFTAPHTLVCGHSFCLKCLRTLAKIMRSCRGRPPLERLRLRCPSCRKLTPARPFLRRRAAVNYALKELVNEWFDSPYATGSIEYLTLRSIASQTNEESKTAQTKAALNKPQTPATKSALNKTENPATKAALNQTDTATKSTQNQADVVPTELAPAKTEPQSTKAALNKPEDSSDDESNEDSDDGIQWTDDDISQTYFRRILFHNITSNDTIAKDIDAAISVVTSTHQDEANLSDDNILTSSSDAESEPEIVPFLADLNVVNAEPNPQPRRRLNIFQVLTTASVIGLFLTECAILWRGIISSRSRLALTCFWFIYGSLVVYVARGFFPWMAVYTVIYFVILYADISHPVQV